MIRTADTFEPMGPFKVAKAKDIGIEVDGVEKSVQEAFDDLDFEAKDIGIKVNGVEKSVQEAFDDLDFENLGKEEIEKVNELPDWENADEDKLYVVKSEPVSYTKLVSYYDEQENSTTSSLVLYGSNNPNDGEGNEHYTVMPNNLTETEFIKSNPSSNKYYYLPSEKCLYVSRQALGDPEDYYEIVDDNWVKMSINNPNNPAKFIEIDHMPTIEENDVYASLMIPIWWIVTEQSQSNDSGKLQIYLKDTSKTNCWFMIKVDNDVLPVMNIIDKNNSITSVPIDKVYFKPISIDDIWEE